MKDISWCCFNTFNVFLDGHFSYDHIPNMLSSIRGKGFVEVYSNSPVRAKASADLPFIQRSNKHFWHIDWDSMGWSSLQSFSLHASKSCELILSLRFITPHLVPSNHAMFYEHQLHVAYVPGGWSFLVSVFSRIKGEVLAEVAEE